MMKKENFKFNNLILLVASLFVLSCMPEKHQVKQKISDDDNLSSSVTDDENTSESTIGTLPEANNFLQQGVTKSSATMSLFADFNDSFLLRGNNIIEFLSEEIKTSQSNFCLIANFTGATGSSSKNILVLSARVRSYYSTALNTKEYFLQVDPNNKENNKLDCLTVSLNNTLSSLYGTTNVAYSFSEVCPDCNINISSQSLKIFSPFGSEVTDLSISHLYLNLIPALGSSSGSNASCSINQNCTSIGYNCCLAGQCVNHGEVKPGISTTSNEYQIALQVINARPELISNYEDVFYVCPMMVPTDTNNNGNGDPDDPIQQAGDLFQELTDYYNCLTPKIDEISICKLDYPNASTLMSSGAYPFKASKDDLTFSSINPSLTGQNIAQIDFAGKTYFKEKLFDTDTEVVFDTTYGSFGAKNDDLSSEQQVDLNIPLPADATNNIMSIYYKVDGSCQKLGSSLARCKKSYVQGQNSTPARPSDHPSGQVFKLPSYASSNFNVIVKVGGSPVSSGTDTWQLVNNSVVFNVNLFPIYNNQTIELTYFVEDNVDNLTSSIEAAQAKVDDHCACDPLEDPCSLKPVVTENNGVSSVTSYVCVYPDANDSEAPLQETIYISAKAVPHKFFDSNGANFNLGEIGSEFDQEGKKFEYNDGNNLKPNNLTESKGFNEIYGTMNNGAAAPVPPTVLNVKKGTTYDIFVDEGAFSTCLNCGTDYYSNMQKLFPNNFEWKGAGYFPDLVESRRRTNQGDYNADDMRFGRACFVPAAMIPWTHVANANVTEQRRNRLDAQHFLFANGYNKDWYGFDYGSVIGSYDGVSWFAIGSQRKITAKSTKLYIAINAYFGDLTINNTFKVTVSEMTSIVNSGSLITHDLDNDGAQCQKAHVCSKDEDCITQLGYDYTCQNVNSFITPWPQFDTNGNEMSGSSSKGILSLIGGSNGEVKRCVYRGRGAICEQASFNTNSSTSYTQSSLAPLHQCSQNTTCELISSPAFNDRISRFGESPGSQNIQSFITDKTDTFGLAARVLGRPYNFYGNKTMPGTLQAHFQNINVKAMCVPGKAVELFSNTQDSNYLTVTNREADKITNVGRTLSSNIGQDVNYFSSCPATDDDGNFTNFQLINLEDSSHQPYAIKNNLSTNSLILNSFDSLNLFNDDENPVRNIGYHKNTCLRAPGAKCFSDFECAPNSFISTKVKSLTSVNGEISNAEKNFWEEELVCANSQPRYLPNSIYPNPLYETYEHHCCRETGKDFTYVPQPHEGTEFKVIDNAGNPLIPGVNQDYNDPQRYSRTHTVYDKLINEPSKYPSFVSASPQPIAKLLLSATNLKQYNTLHLNNSRMCCTGNWVREFASGTNGNGGGHKFTPTKQQTIDPTTTLKPLSWNHNNIPPLNNFGGTYYPIPFNCTQQDYLSSDCEIKNLSAGSTEETKYLEWFGTLELIGIPQVLVDTNNTIMKPVATDTIDIDNDGTIDFDLQQDITSLKLPVDNTIKDVNDDGIPDIQYAGTDYYSASSYDNFELGSSKLKKVFSEDKFNCCIPTGIQVDSSTPNESCCTGLSATNDDGITRCCLNDYTNVSVYTNRYVSSEGARFNGQDISESDIDAKTGYIKKEIVYEMAKSMCCSGTAQYGVAIGDYLIPVDGAGVANNSTRRWLYSENIDDSGQPANAYSLFGLGQRWNHHVYCVPADGDSGSGGNTGGSTQE